LLLLVHALLHVQAIWAISAAPLFMSNDLGNVSVSSKAILLNTHLLKIDQDPLGRMGRRFMHTLIPPMEIVPSVVVAAAAATGDVGVVVDGPPPPLPLESVQGWSKELANGDVAVALVNMAGEPRTIELDLTLVGFAAVSRVEIHDIWTDTTLGTYVRTFTSAEIPPHGTALLRIQWI
jgi:alpha-galactosidase